LNPNGKPSVFADTKVLHLPVGHLREGQVGQDLLDTGRLHITRNLNINFVKPKIINLFNKENIMDGTLEPIVKLAA
jgi:hypothetical protein